MKNNVILKVLVILIIIAISLISFVGIFVPKLNRVENLIPEYLLSMNLEGSRVAKIVVDDSVKEVIYDAEGNVATDGENEDGTLKEGYTKKEEKINPDEVLTAVNFEVSKDIIEKRLQAYGVQDYTVRHNKENGEVYLELPDDTNADNVIYNMAYTGDFKIVDSETDEVLMDNSDVKLTQAVYEEIETGIRVVLNIEFNKESYQKLEDMSKKYISYVDEQSKLITKKVAITLDGQALLDTYFSETITNGVLPLTIGSISTNNEEILSYLQQASQVAAIINSGKMPVQYVVESNNYLETAVDLEVLQIIIYALIGIVGIALIYLCIKYKKNGIFLSIAYVGYVALVLLAIRFANVVIALESIVTLIILLVANFMFNRFVLNRLQNKELNIKEVIKESNIRYVSILFPLVLIAIVFTFIKWIPITSIGMTMFWGLIIMFIYNYIVMNTLLKGNK